MLDRDDGNQNVAHKEQLCSTQAGSFDHIACKSDSFYSLFLLLHHC